MSDCIDLAIETIVNDSLLAKGYAPEILLAGESIRPAAGKRSNVSPKWTKAEDQFVIDHIQSMTAEEIGMKLGRSENSVHIRIVRKGLPTQSRLPGWLTANQVAKLMGKDGHVISGWVDKGILPGKILPGKRRIRAIDFNDLKRWLCTPENWPYFDEWKINNEYLRRLINKAKTRWGDEWWTTRQMADYHQCDIRKIGVNLELGKLHSIHCPGIGGRGKDTWANRYIRKSDAIQWTSRTRRSEKKIWTKRGDDFILSSRANGKEFTEIARMMKWDVKRVMYRYKVLISRR